MPAALARVSWLPVPRPLLRKQIPRVPAAATAEIVYLDMDEAGGDDEAFKVYTDEGSPPLWKKTPLSRFPLPLSILFGIALPRIGKLRQAIPK